MRMQSDAPVCDGYDSGVGADLLSGAAMNQPVNIDVINNVDHADGQL